MLSGNIIKSANSKKKSHGCSSCFNIFTDPTTPIEKKTLSGVTKIFYYRIIRDATINFILDKKKSLQNLYKYYLVCKDYQW